MNDERMEELMKFKCIRVINAEGGMGEEATHRLHDERKIWGDTGKCVDEE